MLTSEAVIQTDQPDRYLARLGKHASKMGPHLSHGPRAHASDQAPPEVRRAEWSATSGSVTLNWGRWTMQAAPGALTLRAEAADEQYLRRIQAMLTARLEKLGRREHLTINWQPPTTLADYSTSG